MGKKITLLDYGMCNLLNVARAFEKCGASVSITENPAVALDADKLVVPGVGAFPDSMREIASRGFDGAIKRYIETGRPFLGICVGMQILFESSEEFGDHKGLGILQGAVKAISTLTIDGVPQRVPHIGWSHLIPTKMNRSWKNSFLADFEGKNPAVYFVHSFEVIPSDPSIRLADTGYGGHQLCAAVQRDNVMATQFHPERSGPVGLKLIENFIRT